MNKAPISEIFSSIQGEGILVGVKQIFIRFSGCNIERCAFCDERTNKRSFKTVKEVMTVLEKFRQREKFHSMSLTGGEALLYPDFLRQLCKELKKEKILIYLETNGTLVDNLKFIKNYLDFIAMDIKLPSSTLRRSYFNEHEKFLKVSPRKKTFIKVVVTKGTKFSCFKKAVTLVKKIDKKTPFVIQPATEKNRQKMLSKEKILLFYDYALKSLGDVRVIPQIHKIIGVK